MQTEHALDLPIEALMEPTGNYGDPLRVLLLGHGVQAFMLSRKRVHDAAEVFDGVPSMHDGTAGTPCTSGTPGTSQCFQVLDHVAAIIRCKVCPVCVPTVAVALARIEHPRDGNRHDPRRGGAAEARSRVLSSPSAGR